MKKAILFCASAILLLSFASCEREKSFTCNCISNGKVIEFREVTASEFDEAEDECKERQDEIRTEYPDQADATCNI